MIWQADLHIMDHGDSWITSERLRRQSKTYQTGSVRQDIWDKTDLDPASGRDRNIPLLECVGDPEEEYFILFREPRRWSQSSAWYNLPASQHHWPGLWRFIKVICYLFYVGFKLKGSLSGVFLWESSPDQPFQPSFLCQPWIDDRRDLAEKVETFAILL